MGRGNAAPVFNSAQAMNILISADKFKDCLSARAANQAIAEEIARLHPDYTLHPCPLTDGGDGFAEILTEAAGGALIGMEVSGPRGIPLQAGFGIVRAANIPAAALERLNLPRPPAHNARIAIVEMAAASGLALLGGTERNPWQTHTRGTGELIAAAIRMKVEAIVIGIGGSATSDLGLGALAALGYHFTTSSGHAIASPAPENWQQIEQISGSLPEGTPPLRICCDVTNPLLGSAGAVAVYAPQKGLAASDAQRFEAQTEQMARRLCQHHGLDLKTQAAIAGSGAGGGIAFGLLCAAGSERAQIVSGFSLVADWLELHSRLAAADAVITGEGRFDDSSLRGKGPGALAQAALAAGKPVHVFAGQATASPQPNLFQHSITPANMPLEQALACADELLRKSVAAAFA